MKDYGESSKSLVFSSIIWDIVFSSIARLGILLKKAFTCKTYGFLIPVFVPLGLFIYLMTLFFWEINMLYKDELKPKL